MKLHPAIHTIRSLTQHVEEEFGTITWGMKHTTPKKDDDVKKLEKAYQEVHKDRLGRQPMKSRDDCAKDLVTKGFLDLWNGGVLARWIDGRTYPQATYELWDEYPSSEDDSGQEDEQQSHL